MKIKAISFKIYYVNYHRKYILKELFWHDKQKIVLLILAGISISMLTGQNGILNRAQEAKEKTEAAVLEEKIKLAVAEAQMSNNGYEELSTENLNYELIKDGTKAIVSDNADGTKHVLFLDEKKEYKLDNNGNIEDLNIDFDTKYVAPSSQDETRNDGVIGIVTSVHVLPLSVLIYWGITILEKSVPLYPLEAFELELVDNDILSFNP